MGRGAGIRRLLAFLLAGALAGCAGTPTRPGDPDGSARPVWPPPPARPRVEFVRTIGSPADLGVRPSFFGRVANLVTGGRRGGEPFVKPYGIAFDEEGNLCLSDTGTNAVSFFDLSGGKYRRYEGSGRTKFVSPVSVARRKGVLYVADSGLRSVLALDRDGKELFRIREGIGRPSGLAVLGDTLYVSDAERHDVSVFDLAGKHLFRFGRRGTGEGEFNFPTHLAGDGKGRLYVTDTMNSRVQVFEADGRFVRAIGSLGDGSGHFSRPKGVAVDGSGRAYVADALFDNLQIFDPSGRFLLDVGTAGTGIGEFWMPAGVAVRGDGEIYVADSYNCRVQVFRPAGPQ